GEHLPLEFFRPGAVALDGKLESAVATVCFGIVAERPCISGAVGLDGRGPELAGGERRHKGAARLVRAVDEPDRQPGPLVFAVQVQAEGTDRPSSSSLLAFEPAEEHAA